MASTLYPPPNERPRITGHLSFNDRGLPRVPISEGRITSIFSYVGFDVFPNESVHDDSVGRWHRARTIIMPSTRDLEHLVKTQSSSNETAMEKLYGLQMKGPKRDHITEVINERDTTFPDYKHELVYLELKDKNGNNPTRSRRKTRSMHIVLRYRIRHRLNSNASIPAQPSAPGPVNMSQTGQKPIPERPVPASMGSRTIGMPPQNHVPMHNPHNATLLRSSVGGEGYFQSPRPPAWKVATFLSENDDSLGNRSASPASTLSTDTARSTPRMFSDVSHRNSYLQLPTAAGKAGIGADIRTTSIMEEETCGEHAKESASVPRSVQADAQVQMNALACSKITPHGHSRAYQDLTSPSKETHSNYTSIKVDLPPRLYASASSQTDPVKVVPTSKQAAIEEVTDATSTAGRFDPEHDEDDNTSIEDSGEELELDFQDSKMVDGSYQKPSWMENLQPGKRDSSFPIAASNQRLTKV